MTVRTSLIERIYFIIIRSNDILEVLNPCELHIYLNSYISIWSVEHSKIYKDDHFRGFKLFYHRLECENRRRNYQIGRKLTLIDLKLVYN